MIQNVLKAKGVEGGQIEKYITNSSSKKHSYLMGVADPTSPIPEGYVFITGMDERVRGDVFLARHPCTESLRTD